MSLIQLAHVNKWQLSLYAHGCCVRMQSETVSGSVNGLKLIIIGYSTVSTVSSLVISCSHRHGMQICLHVCIGRSFVIPAYQTHCLISDACFSAHCTCELCYVAAACLHSVFCYCFGIWSNCEIRGRGTLWRVREREPIMEVWERSLQRGPRAEPLARGFSWSWRLFCFWTLHRPVELVGFSVFHSVQCGSVSESCEISHLS